MRTELSTPTEWLPELLSYSDWMRAAGRPSSTLYLRGYHLRRLAIGARASPLDVTYDQLVEHLAAATWSSATRRSVQGTMRSFFGWLHASGRRADNPAALLPPVGAPHGRPRPAPESAVAIGLSLTDARVKLMVELASGAGLRCCEIAVVSTEHLVEDDDGWSLRVYGKGGKVRMVPLSDSLGAALRQAPAGYLFPGQIAGHLSAAYVSKLISRALPGDWTAHTLRHRFASRAYSADGDIRAVQELLGHASVVTTQIYTKVPDGALRRAVTAAAIVGRSPHAA